MDRKETPPARPAALPKNYGSRRGPASSVLREFLSFVALVDAKGACIRRRDRLSSPPSRYQGGGDDGLRPVLSDAARRSVERAGRVRVRTRADARGRAARLSLGLDRRAPLQRLRPLP